MSIDYCDIAERFDISLAAVAKALNDTRLEWFVIGGWALDLFLNVRTRTHKDLEISIWRDQAGTLFDVFADRQIDQVVGHKRYQSIFGPTDFDSRGHLIIRNAAVWEQQPIDIELFLSSRDEVNWSFRKQPAITVSLDSAVVHSASGLRVLAPHLVLLFKAWFFPNMESAVRDAPQDADFFRKCWQVDCKDFETVLPFLSASQRQTLKQWFEEYLPDIPWLNSF